MRFDRRIPLFAILAVVCFALVPLADASLRYVPYSLGGIYVGLTVLFAANWLAARRR